MGGREMKVTLPQKPDYQEMIKIAAQTVGNLTVLEALSRTIQSETISLDVNGKEGFKASFCFPCFGESLPEIMRHLTEALREATFAFTALTNLPASFRTELERLKRFARENGHEIV
jgi:hypothetical protein